MNDAYPTKYRNCVKAGVAARKIDLMLGEFVVEFPASGSGELVLKSGKKLDAGLVVSSSLTPFSRTNEEMTGHHLGTETQHRPHRTIPWTRSAH